MRTIAGVLLLLSSAALSAQTPYLVKDINTTYLSTAKSSAPTSFAAWNGRTYFTAATEAEGRELWSTDGTSAGTHLVADIIPGPSSSGPNLLTVVNGQLLFNARDVDHGTELWTTDGSTAGTQRLLDLNPGPSSSSPSARILYKSRMLFSADNGASGRELWSTDGTAAGTRLVRDLEPGTASSSPSDFVQLGDFVYFLAKSGLWKTDGTESGTTNVATVIAQHLAAAGSQLFFEGFTTATNWELWASDGTESGTRMVMEILPGTRGGLESSVPLTAFTVLGNRVLFPAIDDTHGRELWVSDGTAAGTHLVRDFIPGSRGGWDFDFDRFVVFGGRAYFPFADAEHGLELWVTDGTDNGTMLFADLVPGSVSSAPYNFAVSNGRLYFVAKRQVWISDGSVAGTRALKGPNDIESALWPADGRIYFAGTTTLNGAEPWVTDGTDAGTRMIANLTPDPTPSSLPALITATRDLVFFVASRGNATNPAFPDFSLWRSDGTEDGTFPLSNSITGNRFTAAGSYLFASDLNNETFSISNGTPEGTGPADELLRRLTGAQARALYPFGDTLFLNAGSSLWKTTVSLAAPALSLGSNAPSGLVEFAGQYAFYASTQGLYDSDTALWITDGTRAGTAAIVPKLNASSLSPLVSAAGTLYFTMVRHDEKPALWKSDGTFDGTVNVKELSFENIWTTKIIAAGRKVFFENNGMVWVTDGTDAGTLELARVGTRPTVEIIDFKAAGDRLVFLKRQNTTSFEYAYELWTSDGTPAGMRLLKSLGPTSTQLTAIDGLVYFVGSDDVHGTELWVTDGTAAGTTMLFDLNPGAASSTPYGFAKARNTLFFAAQHPLAGIELWALPLSEPVLSIRDARATEGDTVRFVVSLNPASTQPVTVGYATSDVAARAGDDYQAASGTLTFAPGETSKTIDVRALGDTAAENNETFLVTLGNVNGARIAQAVAGGVITDDDQAADLSITPYLRVTTYINDDAIISNAGPRTATSLTVTTTATPTGGGYCYNCAIPAVASGQSVTVTGESSSTSEQTYRSATVVGRERDPQPSNNSTMWTTRGTMGMNAAFLTPGASATITARFFSANPVITNSDPAVVTIPAAITKLTEGTGTLAVTALKPGTATIRIDQTGILLVTVVPAGITPRWPGAVQMLLSASATDFDRSESAMVTPSGHAPLTGAVATGTIVVTSGERELARQTVYGTTRFNVPFYLPVLGANVVRVTYSGDATFLPQTYEAMIFVHKGKVSLTGGLVPSTGAFKLTVHAEGSPLAAPTGTLVILNGSTELTRVTLAQQSDGTSIAEATLTGLPASPTITVQYLGDSYYDGGSQQMRVVIPRQRSARH
jgi:ELWxxDGT repeat protein